VMEVGLEDFPVVEALTVVLVADFLMGEDLTAVVADILVVEALTVVVVIDVVLY